MIRLRDEWGWTGWAMGLGLGLIVLAVVGLLLVLWWWGTPRDAHGNPLACLHSHQETYYETISTGKSVVIVPVTDDVCDAWASPKP